MDEIEKRIREFLETEGSTVPEEPLEADTLLFEKGIIDSIVFLRLLSFLDGELGVRVRDTDMKAEKFNTIRAIAHYVKDRR